MQPEYCQYLRDFKVVKFFLLFYKKDGIIFSKYTYRFLTSKHSDRWPSLLILFVRNRLQGESLYLSFVKSLSKYILVF